MKKIIALAFCLTLCFSAFTVSAVNFLSTSKVIIAPTDEPKVIKMNALPDAVKSTLASESYKDWKVKQIKEVKMVGFADQPELATQYEVKLMKGKDVKTVRFLGNGEVSN